MADAHQRAGIHALPVWLVATLFISGVWGAIAAAMVVLFGLASDVITDPGAAVTAGIVLQALLGNAKDIYSYIVGGSASSDRKDELLAKPAEIIPVPPVPPGTVVTTKTTVTPVVTPDPGPWQALPDEERLAKMESQLLALPAGPDRDKLTADIDALRAKIAAKGIITLT